MYSDRRFREKLKSLSRKSTVTSYINEFRNTVIGIKGIGEEETLDKFCSVLKPMFSLELLKSGPENHDSPSNCSDC